MSQDTMQLQASITFMNRSSDRPDRVRILRLAGLPHLDWDLCEVCPEAADVDWVPPAPVAKQLARSVKSGKRYPPALGLARAEVGQLFAEQQPTQAEFEAAYAKALQTYLSRQHDAPFVLAQALTDDGHYRSRGEWYWVLRISGNPPVASWVSDEFHIYDNEIDDFDLTGQQMKQLGYSG